MPSLLRSKRTEVARIYANENYPQPVVDKLRELGHDVLTSHEAGKSNRQTSDDNVLLFAEEQRRIVLTLNRRDFRRLHRQVTFHCGIVACTEDLDFPSLASRVDEAIRSCGSVERRLIRVRRDGFSIDPPSAGPPD